MPKSAKIISYSFNKFSIVINSMHSTFFLFSNIVSNKQYICNTVSIFSLFYNLFFFFVAIYYNFSISVIDLTKQCTVGHSPYPKWPGTSCSVQLNQRALRDHFKYNNNMFFCPCLCINVPCVYFLFTSKKNVYI